MLTVVTAGLVGAFGGFHYRSLVEITPRYLPVLAGLLAGLIALRRRYVRGHPLHVRVWTRLRSAWASPPAQAARPVFLATRPTVLILGLLSLSVFGYSDGAPPFRLSTNEVSNLLARWDTGWYLGIAREGYRWDEHVTGSQNVAFFPLYPTLMRWTGALLGNRQAPEWTIFGAPRRIKLLVGGLIISLGAFFWALVYLYRLAREDLDDSQARTALALLACYPFAVFFSAVYTESLFLLTTVAAFFHFRRGEALPAAGWGFAAGLTRPNGCLLSLPLALMLLGRLWEPLRRGAVSRDESRPSSHPAALALAAAMPGLAMLAHTTYIFWLTGRPFAWVETQAGWGRSYGIPFSYEVAHIAEHGLYGFSFGQPLNMMNTVAALVALALIWPTTRSLGIAYSAFTIVNLVPTLTTGMLGVGRYTSVLFPNFLVLGLLIPVRKRFAWIAAFAVLQGLAAVLFFTWRTMF
jgi:hypothetical protein